MLREYRRKSSPMKFGDEDEIEIDVTSVQPAEAARRIIEFVERSERDGRTWVEGDEGMDYGV